MIKRFHRAYSEQIPATTAEADAGQDRLNPAPCSPGEILVMMQKTWITRRAKPAFVHDHEGGLGELGDHAESLTDTPCETCVCA